MTLLDPHTLRCPRRMRATQRAVLVLLEAGPLSCQDLGRHLWGWREEHGERLWLPAGKIVRALELFGLATVDLHNGYTEARLTPAGLLAARRLPRQARLPF